MKSYELYKELYEFMLDSDDDEFEDYQVDSSWIESLEQTNNNGVIMTLLNGNQYQIYNVPTTHYELWMQQQSKGKFWHNYIKDRHTVIRIA